MRYLFVLVLFISVPCLAQDAGTVDAGSIVDSISIPLPLPPGPTEPTGDVQETVNALGSLIQSIKGGEFLLIASALIWLLMNLMKSPLLGGLINKVPKDYKWLVGSILGLAMMLIYKLQNGTGWLDAVYIGVSGLVAMGMHDAGKTIWREWLGKDKPKITGGNKP